MHFKAKAILIVFLLFPVLLAEGQLSRYDSLKLIYQANLKIGVSDSHLAGNLLEMAREIKISDPDLALSYLNSAVELALKDDENRTRPGVIYTEIGNIYLSLGLNYNALDYFFRSYKVHESCANQNGMAYCLSDIGNVYWAEGQYDITPRYYRRALSIFRSLKDTIGQAVAINNLGLVKREQLEMDSAYAYFQQALDLRLKTGNAFLVLHSYLYLAGVHQYRKEYGKAMEFYDKALFMLNNISLPYREDEDFRANLYLSRGQTFRMMGKMASAIESFEAAAEIASRIQSPYHLAMVNINLAVVYNLMELDSKVAPSILQAKHWARRSGNGDLLKSILSEAALIAESNGEYQQALVMMSESASIGDSLRHIQQVSKLSDISKAIELYTREEERKAEVNRLKMRQLIFLILAVSLICIVAGLLFYLRLSRKSRKALESLANASFEGLIIHRRGTVIDLNHKAAQILRSSVEAMKGRNIYDYLSPEYRDAIIQIGESDQETEYQTHLVFPDQSVLEVEVLSRPIFYKGIRARVAAMRDISLYKKMNEENRVLWSAINQMATVLLVTDSKGVITYTNPRFSQITGYEPYEVKGKTPSILKSGKQPPSFYARLWEDIRNGNSWTGEFCNQKKDGSLFWENAIISPVKDNNGTITHFIAIKEDITSRKLQEQELRRKEVMYHSLVSHLPRTAVFLFDNHPRYRLAEGPVLKDFGFTRADFEGKAVSGFLPEPENDPLAERMKKVFTGESYTYTTLINGKNFVVQLVPLFDESHSVFMGMMLMQDVTEKVRQEAILREQTTELQRLNDTKDKFISILAHDLRNPFNSLLGFSDMLKNDYHELDDETRLTYIHLISEGTESTFHLLNNLLEWSKAQADQKDFYPALIDVGGIVSNAVRVLNPMAQAKQIKIIEQVPEDTKVYADPDMLKTVLRNLITNAIKFTPRGGWVAISAHTEILDSTGQPSKALIEVRDNGVGIHPDNLSRLFQINAKFSKEGTDNEKGTGLGLLICKEFVENSEGRIWAESVEGKGSSFFVELPGSAPVE